MEREEALNKVVHILLSALTGSDSQVIIKNDDKDEGQGLETIISKRTDLFELCDVCHDVKWRGQECHNKCKT